MDAAVYDAVGLEVTSVDRPLHHHFIRRESEDLEPHGRGPTRVHVDVVRAGIRAHSRPYTAPAAPSARAPGLRHAAEKGTLAAGSGDPGVARVPRRAQD